jgi:hypothetical protein
MKDYVGYGFYTDDIQDKDWLNLVKTHDKETYQNFLEDVDSEFEDEEEEAEALVEYIGWADGPAQYLANVINVGECEKAGANSIVYVTDYDILLFRSIRFLNDSKRAEYIRSEKDFIEMISRYVPVDNIKFGDIFEGEDWSEPSYFLE